MIRLFQCKHKIKEDAKIGIEDRARVGLEIVVVGKYKLYRCLECHCIVWERNFNT